MLHHDTHRELAQVQELEAQLAGVADPLEKVKTLHEMGRAFARLGDYTHALEHYLEMQRLARELENPAWQAAAANSIGLLYMHREDWRKALEHLEQYLPLAEKSGEQVAQAEALDNCCKCYTSLGEYEAALASGLHSIELSQKIGDRKREAKALFSLGELYQARGDLGQALDYWQRCLALCQASDLTLEQVRALQSLGDIYWRQGQGGLALESLHDALRLAEGMEARAELLRIHRALAAIYKAHNDFERALAHYERFHTLQEEIFNAESDQRLKSLEVMHQVETVRSEQDFRSLFNTIDHLVFVLDGQGHILRVNDTVVKRLGYAEEELIGQSVLMVHPEERRAEAARIVAEMLAGQTQYCPVPVQAKDGQHIPVETRLVRGKWSGQDVLFGVTKDISELQASEEKFSKAFHANPALMAISSGEDGRFIDVNQALLTTLGYTREDLIGQSTLELGLFADPEQRRAATRIMREQGYLRDFEATVRTKDGDTRRGLFSADFIRLQDRQLLLTTMIDITEHKRAEATLQQRSRELALIQQASQAFSSSLELSQVLQTVLEEVHNLLHPTGTSLWLLDPAYGADPVGSELVCQHAIGPYHARIIGWRLPAGLGLTWQAVHSGLPLILADATLDPGHFKGVDEKIGMETRSLLSLPLHTQHGVIGLLNLVDSQPGRFTPDDLRLLEPIAAAAANALENARLFKEAQQTRAAAEAASHAKSTFLSKVSHDLRTPLNGILGYAQILKNDPSLNDWQRDRLEVIYRSGTHLLTLINDILDLAKIEAGKVELHPTDFHLPALLQDVTDLARVRAEQKGITFLFEPGGELPHFVRGDPKRLEQVLLNLLGNAVKFTEQGRVIFKVTVMGSSEYEAGSREGTEYPQLPTIRFSIEDTGVGIAPEHVQTIFEAFEQAGEVGQRAAGTGLGLTISRQLVQLMGGELQVHSQPGAGSVFWFDLALPQAPGADIQPSAQERLIVGVKGARRTILVVDDEAENRAVLVGMLAPLGFEVVEAEDGPTAIQQAAQLQPDAILLDLIMPGMDGYQVARHVRQAAWGQASTIIAVSASVYPENQQASLEVGCNAFLPKPIQHADLLAQLGRCLGLEWVYAEGEPGAPARQAAAPALRWAGQPARPALPAAWLQRLKQAAVQADMAGIDRLIDEIRPEQAALADELAALAGDFEYERILALIEDQEYE